MTHLFFKKGKDTVYPKDQKYSSGYAMLISVIFFTFLSLAIVSGVVAPSVREFKISSDLTSSRQSFFLSESGIEDAYYRLKNSKSIGASTSITLAGNTATTSISDSGYNEKTIASTGDVYLRQRKNQMKINAGTGVNFAYGIQAGTGGFIMSNNAVVNGNVYSNADIIGSNNADINGSAYAAGTTSTIDNVSIGKNGIGDANAHTVKNSTIAGSLYCKTGSGNNKACNTSVAEPEAIDFPVSQEMIDKWKADAELGGTYSGNKIISTPGALGPIKITGNLTINENIIITGTIYVLGTISTANNVDISLSSSYGATGGIIITDSPVVLSNNVEFYGSGDPNSKVMLITTSTCPSAGCTNTNALEVLNNVGAVILNAQNGTAHLNNNVTLNEIVGNSIILDNGATVNYLSGLANSNFTSGPTGGWKIKSWKEVK